MKIKKILFAALSAVLCALLSGCELFPANTDELLSPPALTGDYAPIEQALKKAAKNYTLHYPSAGEYRSAFVLQDLDSDGRQEAIAFYSKTDDEMHINVICEDEKNKWRSVDDLTITAGDVERIEFCDLDQDGVKEILVGWEVLPLTDKQLAVYRLVNRKLQQQQIFPYTDFVCCDLDTDGQTEIFVQTINTAENTNTATVYRAVGNDVVAAADCPMDCKVQKIYSQTPVLLEDGTQAIYVDEVKSAGAVTEVLFMQSGKLINPLLEYAATENVQTVRSASLMCTDIDQDGRPEIPVAKEITSVDSQNAEKAYYTVWCSFTGTSLLPVKTVIINQADGYSIELPEQWVDHIAVMKDSNLRTRLFFACDDAGHPTVELFELAAYSINIWDAKMFNRPIGYEEYLRTSNSVIVGKVVLSDNALATTSESLKKMLVINE
ncbi:MAG: VCBS repeat-containing protein [Clostridia bacterium]|nr:VCBS repeat-containing protein [Clostridia bacterium]